MEAVQKRRVLKESIQLLHHPFTVQIFIIPFSPTTPTDACRNQFPTTEIYWPPPNHLQG